MNTYIYVYIRLYVCIYMYIYTATQCSARQHKASHWYSHVLYLSLQLLALSAVCCSVLQCAAVCCSVMQCHMFQQTARSMLQFAVCCTLL